MYTIVIFFDRIYVESYTQYRLFGQRVPRQNGLQSNLLLGVGLEISAVVSGKLP